MARRRTELVKADADPDLLPRERAPRVPAARESSVGEIEFVHEGEFVEDTDGPDGPGEPGGPGDTLVQRPEDILAEPPDARDISAELAAPPRRKLPWLTLVLAACIVAAGAFSGGALVEKHHLNGTTTAGRGFTLPTGAAGRTGTGTGAAGGRTFGGGFGGGFGGAGGTGSGTAGGTGSGVTIGTVKLVDGKTIYVSDAQGNIVKVTTAGTTKVTESKTGKVSDLKAGQSVTVLGAKKSNGDVAATTVTEGGATGGFGGFGGFGGGAGGASGGTAGGTGGGN